jgi:putative ABC transport system permease protein
MSFAKQFVALLRMNLAGISSRLGLVCTIVVGVACAVGVLVSMLAMGVGARREALGNVRADRAVLLSADAPAPNQSSIAKDVAPLLHELPGIKRNAKGEPIAISLVGVFVQARARVGNDAVGFPIGGVTPGITDYLPELHLTSGRLFQPGLRELIASNKCARQFRDFNVGDKRHMRGGDWVVVGNFDLGRTEGTCAVYGDADTIMSAFGRNTFTQVLVMLQTEASFAELTRAIAANPAFHVVAKHQAEVVEESSRQLNGILNFVSYFVGSIMALAATIGAANSLYAIVDGRRRELATLRALGFDSTAIVTSMLLESVVLALPGALIGALAAWVLFNGFLASPFGTVFRLTVTPALALLGLGWALAMGFLAGLLPAVRASRVPVTVGLRAS